MPQGLDPCGRMFSKIGLISYNKSMVIHILTLFPAMFAGPFQDSIIQRAQERDLVEIKIHNLRDWAVDKHGSVDERPYGGGPGMILRVEPIFNALKEINSKSKAKNPKKILLSPRGETFNQTKARELAQVQEIILICGHYEGFDERIRNFVDEEISLGDFILTGGEIPAMAIVDAVSRLQPGLFDKENVTQQESFSWQIDGQTVYDYPQYTRPESFRGQRVPAVLLSGNHTKIAKWRQEQAQKITAAKEDKNN